MKARARPARSLVVSGLPTPLELRESPRTRRMTLRVDAARGLIQVVVPPGLAEAEAVRFVDRHAGWVRSRLAALPPQRPFVDGARIPVLGVEHVIRHDPNLREAGQRRDCEIRIGGGVEHLARRVRDLLTAEARRLLNERARTMAATLGLRVAAVSLRDTRSRWGSCSATGRLSFSWRLILTPEPVFDYVIAHEVAHLGEMNHSPRFWALVARLTPDAGPGRSWLRRHGTELLRFG
ncbi:MAG: SprT family zinc-dependent metalloprotease [Rhodospirillaceae bacterium]